MLCQEHARDANARAKLHGDAGPVSRRCTVINEPAKALYSCPDFLCSNTMEVLPSTIDDDVVGLAVHEVRNGRQRDSCTLQPRARGFVCFPPRCCRRRRVTLVLAPAVRAVERPAAM